jgi:hypothetical protein
MNSGTFYRASSVRHGRSLASRGGLARTFGSLAGFLVLLFLFSGFYILVDAFTNPIQAGAVALIAAAFIIALASILLFFLLRPRSRVSKSGHPRFCEPSMPGEESALDSPAQTLPGDNQRQDLAYQRLYVDQSRVRR